MLEYNTTSLNLQDVQSFRSKQNCNIEESLCEDIKNEIDVEDIAVNIEAITKQEEPDNIPFDYGDLEDSTEELFKIESKYLPTLNYSSDSISHLADDTVRTFSPEITSMNVVESPIVAINKKRRRKHCCPFCDQVPVNFARHLQRRHKDKVVVQEFLSLEKQSLKRKKLIAKLRREGDFRSSNIVPVMDRNNKFETNYIPCKFCRGYYSHRSLQRHTKKCFFNPNPSLRFKAQIEGQIIMSGEFDPDDVLKTSGLLYMMRADATSLAAKTDPIICEVGRRYIQTHKQKGLLLVAKRNMRRLARLLISVKRITNTTSLTLLDILTPDNFKMLIKATCDIAEYDEETKKVKSPSLAFQMGPLLKNAINVAFSLEIEKPDMFSKRLDDLKALAKLVEADWAHEMSSEVGEYLATNKVNNPAFDDVNTHSEDRDITSQQSQIANCM
ncbi:hypothetical protein MML48_4g00003148 [Holotrichia oblita]|uniref:Uncharacterized protein n=1 Tax=Holotrichia oblita TaxID=644536 RepID=A0ACB9T885_HOLOL|nr:hypothetical protein MML48_4g00003148 [Holotrichia oblita]